MPSALPNAFAGLLARREPQLWLNPERRSLRQSQGTLPVGLSDFEDAVQRWQHFAGLLQTLFPELIESRGIIESSLQRVPALRRELMGEDAQAGQWLLKCDHALPIAGSIKARGGIYEVLLHAERLALAEGILGPQAPRDRLASGTARALFAQHEVAVGSTGNLGLSVGIMAAALGFKSTVHMSADAKAWKKARLRDRGVRVVEHVGDFGAAVAAGREEAAANPRTYFVDDEQSHQLFLGYSVAGLRLKQQLEAMQVRVDESHPLFVYLPCGVGGAPGGITFGLRHMFGDHVHCFLAEPVGAPCMLVRLAAPADQPLSMRDLGIELRTEADGLAVGQASEFAATTLRSLASGVFTETDSTFFIDMYRLARTESVWVEPSAAAGLRGPQWLLNSAAGREYLQRGGLDRQLSAATHVLWTTGGSFVPEVELQRFFQRGEREWQAALPERRALRH